MKFKLLRGRHSEGIENFEVNEIVTSDMDLESVFGSEKFQKVEGSCGTKKCKEDCSDEIVEEQDEEVVETKSEDEDVSAGFPTLAEYVYDGVSILKRKRKYFVHLNGSDLNDDPLTKKEVVPFVNDYFG